MRIALLVGMVAWCTGCGLVGVCVVDDVPGIYVIAVDSATNDTISDTRMIGIARDGMYVDTTRVGDESPPPAMSFAWGRAGVYSIEVHAPGYQRWTREGVVVDDAGRCEPRNTRVVTALMQRE